MLINVTNRPHTDWSPEQLAAAEQYGEIVDFPMPALPADAPDEEADRITALVVRRILRRLADADGAEPSAVICQGDFVLVFRIVSLLKKEGLTVLVPTFTRVTKPTLRPDGTTVPGYRFEFVRFRSY